MAQEIIPVVYSMVAYVGANNFLEKTLKWADF